MSHEDVLRISGSAAVAALTLFGAARLPDPDPEAEILEWALFLLIGLSAAAVALFFALPRISMRGYLVNGLAASSAMATVSGIRLYLNNRSTLHEYSDAGAFQLGFFTVLLPALTWVAVVGGALALWRAAHRAPR